MGWGGRGGACVRGGRSAGSVDRQSHPYNVFPSYRCVIHFVILFDRSFDCFIIIQYDTREFCLPTCNID